MEKRTILRSGIGVAMATLASRLLGLLRVRLESAVLGGGTAASAWFLAFMIPNLFRRVLGEGAVGTALIPLVAETEQQEGRDAVKRKLTVVFAVLGGVLALLVLIVSGISWLILKYSAPVGSGLFQRDYVRMALQMLPILMPYAFFICLVGVVGAVLNYAKIFFLPALAALLLNIFLLGGLTAAWYWQMGEVEFLPLLSMLVPLSGVIHLILMLFLLLRCGNFPLLSWRVFRDCRVLKDLWVLAFPGILSFSALQLSFLADRLFAASLDSRAVPALTYVDRIVDLPIGVFAVSLGGVLMAAMSRSAADGDQSSIGSALAYSLRMVWFICLPLAAAVVFFHEPMLRLLCLGGRYTGRDLDAARMVAVFYGCGIPLFCSLKVILPAFHARKKMRTTLVVSLIAISANLILNVILMVPLRQGGIALATVCSSFINNALLLFLLKREGFVLEGRKISFSLVRSLLCTLFSAGAALAVYRYWLYSWSRLGRWQEFWSLAVIGITMLVFYLGSSALSKAPELRELLPVLRRRQKKESAEC